MKFSFFTFGGRFSWEDVFFYQGWRIQRKIKTNRYRLLDSHNICRENSTFENCKNTLLKYISACEIQEPKPNAVILIHGFGRTQKSLLPLTSLFSSINADIIAFNYCSTKADLRHQGEILAQFISNLANRPNLFFVTIGAGCLVLRKFFDVCEDYRAANIKGIINVNPLNSGSDFAFLANRISVVRKIFGPMLSNITPDETLKISRIPQDIPLYLIFAPSKFTALFRKIFKRLESFPQLSPPAETSYSQYYKEIKPLTWFPMNNENMLVLCKESIDELVQKS